MSAVTAAAPQARFGNLKHAALASLWFGFNFHWLPIGFVLIQSQLRGLVPHEHYGSALGNMVGVGAIFAVAVPPLVGYLSDYLYTPWGRRRPIIFAGTILNLVGLGIMMTAHSYAQLFVGYLWIQFFANAAGAAYAGVIPDVVPNHEFGKASGFLAAMNQGGGLAGVLTTSVLAGAHQLTWAYAVIGLITVLTMIPALIASRGEGMTRVERGPSIPMLEAVRRFIAPIWTGDFGWVIFTRLMVTAAITIVAYYLSPFFHDIVKVDNADQFTSNWLGIVFVAAIPFGITGGMISDRLGRKIFVYLSGAAQSIVAVVFIVLYPPLIPLVIVLGVVYGLGYGLYYAVDWALACDTLPDRSKSAKDMGLFHVAQTLPQTIAPAIGGYLLDYFNSLSPNSGYRAVFASAIVFFILGTVFVSRIKSVR
ncbi:MAG TPA: MFS transporter [Candidatus Dormibacteraeota bacterium]|jgi:MFS family permease